MCMLQSPASCSEAWHFNILGLVTLIGREGAALAYPNIYNCPTSQRAQGEIESLGR